MFKIFSMNAYLEIEKAKNTYFNLLAEHQFF